jgi:hypothetical protein
MLGPFKTIEGIKQANRASGGYWFSPATMKGFASRVSSLVFGGHFFVTSERVKWDKPRFYTVRMAENDGEIRNASDFMQYASYNGAISAARRFAEQATEE